MGKRIQRLLDGIFEELGPRLKLMLGTLAGAVCFVVVAWAALEIAVFANDAAVKYGVMLRFERSMSILELAASGAFNVLIFSLYLTSAVLSLCNLVSFVVIECRLVQRFRATRIPRAGVSQPPPPRPPGQKVDDDNSGQHGRETP